MGDLPVFYPGRSTCILPWEIYLYFTMGDLPVFYYGRSTCILPWETYLYFTMGDLPGFYLGRPTCILLWETYPYFTIGDLPVFYYGRCTSMVNNVFLVHEPLLTRPIPCSKQLTLLPGPHGGVLPSILRNPCSVLSVGERYKSFGVGWGWMVS